MFWAPPGYSSCHPRMAMKSPGPCRCCIRGEPEVRRLVREDVENGGKGGRVLLIPEKSQRTRTVEGNLEGPKAWETQLREPRAE